MTVGYAPSQWPTTDALLSFQIQPLSCSTEATCKRLAAVRNGAASERDGGDGGENQGEGTVAMDFETALAGFFWI